jgi:DNA-binding IclR family transcriptional regulator
VRTTGWVGRTTPLYCTAVGRALLIDEADDAVRQILAALPMERVGPSTATDAATFMERLDTARASGYAIADEELEAGLVSVAAPVRDPQGHVIAAINLAGPKYRFEGHVDAAGTRLIEAAEGLSTALRGAAV